MEITNQAAVVVGQEGEAGSRGGAARRLHGAAKMSMPCVKMSLYLNFFYRRFT